MGSSGPAPVTMTMRSEQTPGTVPSTSQLLADGALLAIGQCLAGLGLLVGTRVVTEVVPTGVYGTVSLLLGLAMLSRNVACVPVLQAALRFYPEAELSREIPRLREVVRRLLTTTTTPLVAVLLAVGGTWSALGRAGWLVAPALGGLVALDVARSTETTFLTAARRQGTFAVAATAEAWGKPLLAIAAVTFLGTTAESVLLGYAGATAGVLLWLRSVRDPRAALSEGKPQGPTLRDADILRYALPLIPQAIVAWVSALSDRYIVGLLLGLQQAGIYAAAYGLVSMPFLLAHSALAYAVRPAYFSAVSSRDRDTEGRTFRIWLVSTLVVCSAGTLLTLLLRDRIVSLVLAEAYRSGARLLPWIALGHTFLGLATVFEGRLHAQKRTRAILTIHVATAVASVAVTLPLVARVGLVGAAAAAPLYFGIQMVLAGAASSARRVETV